MRAIQVKIHNVRSIHDAVIDLRDMSLLAGANNVGKSNVFDAIRLFYADLKWSDERDGCAVPGQDDEAWVEIEYLPTKQEVEQLKQEYRSSTDTFRVRNYLKARQGSDGKARAGYYAYVDGVLSETLFYGAKNVGSAKVGKLVYIPAVSKVDEHTKLTGPSALRDLVAAVMTKVVSASPAYRVLTEAFSTFESEIKTQQTEDGQSLAILEQEITEELAGWGSTFNLGIRGVQPDDILKSLIQPSLTDESHGREIDQLNFGAGFQRHMVYTLIKLAAKYATGGKQVSAKKEFSPELTWILFEEPEAFLHPVQEEVLFDSLLELASDESTQVLLTTHSSRFVSRSMRDLTRLVRLRRDGGVTSVCQIDSAGLDQLFDESLMSDAEITPALLANGARPVSEIMAALKIELWLQPQRAAAFFSQHVVLVEGPTELALYEYMIDRRLMKAPAPGVMVLDCMGKYNLHRFMSLFGRFGISHSVLYDGDNGSAHDSEVQTTIVGATNEFTYNVTRLDDDIEAELGVSPLPPKQSNRKPQYLLYHLEANLIPQSKLEAVVDLYAKLCPPSEVGSSVSG